MMLAPQVGEPAPKLPLLRTDGTEVGVEELVGGRPTVLVFVRHYG